MNRAEAIEMLRGSNQVSHLFTQLVFDFNSEEWNEWTLRKLPKKELVMLSLFLGGPISFPKEELIIRILSIRVTREKVSKYPSSREGAEQMKGDFSREDLKGMAKHMKLWRSGNKIQLAIVLIGWRDRCRVTGENHLMRFLADLKSWPPQILFPFEA